MFTGGFITFKDDDFFILGIPTFPITIPDPNFSTRFNQSDDKESHLRHLIGCNLSCRAFLEFGNSFLRTTS